MIEGGEVPGFAWANLVPRIVHPIKVAIIEALVWMDAPMSPANLYRSFDHPDYYLSIVAYHAEGLEAIGAIFVAKRAQRRGTTETFYSIPIQMLTRA